MAELGRTFEARIASIIATANTIGPMVDDLRLVWASRRSIERREAILPVDDPDLVPKPATGEPAEYETPELAALRAALLSELDQLPHCNEKAEKSLTDLDHKLAQVEEWLGKQVAHIRGHHETVQMRYAEVAKYEAEHSQQGKAGSTKWKKATVARHLLTKAKGLL